MYSCPKGHNSTEADFCSECGAKIMGVGIGEISATNSNPSAPTVAAAISPCPVCTTPHEEGTGDFCEICGYNFLTGTQGGVPFPSSPPIINARPLPQTQLPNSAPATTPIVSENAPTRWQAIISIDPSLASPDSPPAPVQPPITIDSIAPTNLIGRTSQARAIHPEIPLDLDDAVSSRHAILTLLPDNSLVLRDIGSSNGTMVNGKEIAVMADIQLRNGDEITLGHWTRIKLISN
jgi:pSer/pThr/pTyr-binding forkhead associated (FHA) protein